MSRSTRPGSTLSRTDAAYVVAVVVLLVPVVLTDEQLVRSAAVLLSCLLPTAAITWLLASRRIPVRSPWTAVLGGMATLSLHNANSLVQVGLLGRAVAGGTLPLVTLLGGYVLLLVGAVLMTFPYARRDLGGMIDAAVVALVAASLLWAFVLHDALNAPEVGTGTRVYRLLVVLLLSAILGVLVRAVSTAREARPAVKYLLVAIAATLAGNAADIVGTDYATGARPWYLSPLWLVGYLALGAAAVHPARAQMTRPRVRTPGRLTRRRLALLGTALAINPLLAAVQEARGMRADWLLLMGVTLTLVPLVVVRVAQLAELHADAERRLAHLAAHDELTGLPNRRTLTERLEDAVRRVGTGLSTGAVLLFVDLDDFKEVNDLHGHPTGDRLLQVVGRRIRSAVRGTDLVARLGGDEFVVLCEGDPDSLGEVTAARIRQALAEPLSVDGVTLPCGASIGVAALAPGDPRSAVDLMAAADTRMYEDKRGRRAARHRPAADATHA